ncbi:unannotated protein [freshwater metagenome]|uniref:Unannotated protein n=1 Tax=freshwater metagenome TaxID=449393 RepID=A0A6J7AKC4_9ZZZZ
MEEGGRNTTGDGEATNNVSKCWSWLVDRVVGFGVTDNIGGATSAPEGTAVVATSLRLWSSLAMSRTSHVNDVGVHGSDVFNVDAKFCSSGRPKVCQEYVCVFTHLEQQCSSFFGFEIKPDTSLASVREFDHVRNTTWTSWDQSHCGETSLWVSHLGVFNLDHVRAPFGEHCSGNRNVRPRRNFDHSNSAH